MERSSSLSVKPLSPSDWETLIDDFQFGPPRRQKWTSQYPSISLLDLALTSILRKESPLPLKLNLLVFLEEFSAESLFADCDAHSVTSRLIESARYVIQAPIDGISFTVSLKEQFMVSVTSILIALDALSDASAVRDLENFVDLLLSVANRPNFSSDRQIRAVACECLREFERAYPCLLAEIAGHLWGLCQSERTHAAYSYILLLTTVVHSIVVSKMNVSMVNPSVPLVPFCVPQLLTSASTSASGLNLKELRRVMAFLLESPHFMTPCGMMEFLSMIVPIAIVLELQTSLLKVQFFGLLYSFNPLLCHAVLMMYMHFVDAFDGQESEIARRLMLISGQVQNHLVFKMLALHWLLGFIGLISNEKFDKSKLGSVLSLGFYPSVFDPLALKSLKLDVLAFSSTCGVENGISVVELFEDGLVCVSAFKWLPPCSTESAVAFRTFHKFLICASSHSDNNFSASKVLMESAIFKSLQRMLVDMTLEFQRLVPVVVAFVDRFLNCHKHRWLGERLLVTFDEYLLPKVITDYRLASYFPVLDRIAESDTITPCGLLSLLTKFVVFLVEKHGPDTGLKSWSHGSKILGICRTMLAHHHSSRLFHGLSHLLAFACLYFPDLEIRDSARIYLRLLVCIPGKKLRHILKLGEQLPGISSSPYPSSFFNGQSPQASHDPKKYRNLLSHIRLERAVKLLVNQCWSLSLPSFGVSNDRPGNLEGIRDIEFPLDAEREFDPSVGTHVSEAERFDRPKEPLCVMDSVISEILGILRRHFSCIPDFRYMPGLKIRIPCYLRFKSEPFNQDLGLGSPKTGTNNVDTIPAIYATVLTFSSSSPYGSIPSSRIPFLLGESSRDYFSSDQKGSLDIVPLENGVSDDESFRASVVIELEPREPMPGLIDVAIETNTDDGHVIRGRLDSIVVGIEDMFLRAIVPSDIREDAVLDYYAELFNALWEACSSPSSTGREIFGLKGGKGAAAICGTRSVKLIDVPATSLIQSIECHLAPFVVSVIGEDLVNIVKDGGVIRDVIWKEASAFDATSSSTDLNQGPLHLTYTEEEEDGEDHPCISKREMGCFRILIFLPPRYHLLFQMEVSNVSTLVRIRTDHWPCLAYIDDYLETLFLA
ncbi:hypothetical protein RJ641_011945 [Dillenia turbinata]|uniref:AP-5 complex subunit beta-1 n=1 Tax=Dillenia turbinata TaxID=194707 RepID=A0AAN8Z5K8_9MAGN